MQAFASLASLTVRLNTPKMWLNRNLNFTPFVARVLPTIGNLQGNCLSLSFCLFLGVALVLRGLPSGSDGKESAYNAGDLGSIPGLGRSPGQGNGNPLQYLAWEISWTEEPGKNMG